MGDRICPVCSQPDCGWGGIPANCDLWGKETPAAAIPDEGEALAQRLDDFGWRVRTGDALTVRGLDPGSVFSEAAAMIRQRSIEIARLTTALGEMQEELACALDDLIDHNGDDMNDSRQKRADELRSTGGASHE